MTFKQDWTPPQMSEKEKVFSGPFGEREIGGPIRILKV